MGLVGVTRRYERLAATSQLSLLSPPLRGVHFLGETSKLRGGNAPPLQLQGPDSGGLPSYEVPT